MIFYSDYFILNCIFAKNKRHLKNFIVISLLLVFSLRPVYYLGCLGYYGLNINSIIEQYCVNKDKPELQCDGKCFLAEQLNKASDSNENNSDKFLNVVFESFIPVYISPQPEVKFYSFNIFSTEEKEFKYCETYYFLHESSNFKPPILKFNI